MLLVAIIWLNSQYNTMNFALLILDSFLVVVVVVVVVVVLLLILTLLRPSRLSSMRS